jgi:hypothetical protein
MVPLVLSQRRNAECQQQDNWQKDVLHQMSPKVVLDDPAQIGTDSQLNERSHIPPGFLKVPQNQGYVPSWPLHVLHEQMDAMRRVSRRSRSLCSVWMLANIVPLPRRQVAT